MKTQKRLIMLSTVAILLITAGFTSCSDSGSSKINLSENEQQKEEVFDQIMNNQQMFNDFMNRMMDGDAY